MEWRCPLNVRKPFILSICFLSFSLKMTILFKCAFTFYPHSTNLLLYLAAKKWIYDFLGVFGFVDMIRCTSMTSQVFDLPLQPLFIWCQRSTVSGQRCRTDHKLKPLNQIQTSSYSKHHHLWPLCDFYCCV